MRPPRPAPVAAHSCLLGCCPPPAFRLPPGWSSTIPVCAYVVSIRNAAALDKDGLLQVSSPLDVLGGAAWEAV